MMFGNNEKSLSLWESQKEMRSAFLGGFSGQLISGLIWIAAAVTSYLLSPGYGMVVLFFGSFGLFPLTQLFLRLMGRPASVSKGNGLYQLGSQAAFTVPLNFLLVGAATLYRLEWFFPAAMIVVGAHYLPFITLYGTNLYGLLAVLLVSGGAFLALFGPPVFSLGGWMTGVILIGFAFALRAIVLREEQDLPVHNGSKDVSQSR